MKAFIVTATLLLGLFGKAHSQVVVIGPDGKSASPLATREYCLSMETISPNLKLTRDTTVRGKIADQSRAPLSHSPVELRRFILESKQVTAKTVLTDNDGNVDLGVVKRGNYRLLLAPHRGFKQPERLECSGAKTCTLDTMLIVTPTDQLVTHCPIR